MSSENGIVFQVETANVLKLLASEIYDSPLALLRENLQNAYDAVRMRFVPSNRPLSEGRIDLTISGNTISITDNGIGMTEAVLRENFWRMGSSGKRTVAARQAGVVGTFGIGAMANFGVSTYLSVRTRFESSLDTLTSTAEYANLKIAEECITFDRSTDEGPIGTTVTALLDASHPISPDQALRYLEPYVSLLPVPLYLNGQLISCQTMESKIGSPTRNFRDIALPSRYTDSLANSADFQTKADQNGQVLVLVTDIKIGGAAIEGSLILIQKTPQLMGLRSFFGLAPIPCSSAYEFGGFANLSFLQPTAGREAVNRDSIAHVSRLITMADRAASEALGKTALADNNTAFMQWVVNNNRLDLAGQIAIKLLPDDIDVTLSDLQNRIGSRTAHYYLGTDKQVVQVFSSPGTCLLQLAQVNPRRLLQQRYLQKIGMKEVPDSAQVTHTFDASELDVTEGIILIKTTAILRDDYLVPDVEVFLSDISHGVSVFAIVHDGHLVVHVSKLLIAPLKPLYSNDYKFFGDFMRDFVRTSIYPRVQQFIPSSTRHGVDALRKILERNRELYRYEEAEAGDLEKLFRDLLSSATMDDVLQRAQTTMRSQTVHVTHSQVATIESVMPDVTRSPTPQTGSEQDTEFDPRPPILREDIPSDIKILTADAKHPQINNFSMLLGLSDRLMREYGDFFHRPHTTRIIWAGHRVIYIFADPTGRLSLYYDVELREPLESSATSGGLFPTTTLITKRRIFVPVPDALLGAFKITSGAREFYVRFDILSSDD